MQKSLAVEKPDLTVLSPLSEEPAHGPALHARTLTPAEMTPQIIRAWANLETRALQVNPFLSPYFVLPSIRHLNPHADIRIVLVEDRLSDEVFGVGILELKHPSLHLPVFRLDAYRSIHCYLDGLLVDPRHSSSVINAFLNYFSKSTSPWHAVRFSFCPTEHPCGNLMNGTTPSGLRWHQTGTVQRAILTPKTSGEAYLKSRLNHRYRECRRLLRQLSKHGTVSWHYIAGDDVSTETIESFLDLEHRGWKRDVGTSLASQLTDYLFFRDMIEHFQRERRVFFTELRLNGRAIASTCNLRSGHAGFAFKIGWDTRYARWAPGILNEVQFILAAPDCCRDLDYIDSCAGPGTFIETLWLDRRTLISGVYSTTALGRTVMRTQQLVRTFLKSSGIRRLWCAPSIP